MIKLSSSEYNEIVKEAFYDELEKNAIVGSILRVPVNQAVRAAGLIKGKPWAQSVMNKIDLKDAEIGNAITKKYFEKYRPVRNKVEETLSSFSPPKQGPLNLGYTLDDIRTGRYKTMDKYVQSHTPPAPPSKIDKALTSAANTIKNTTRKTVNYVQKNIRGYDPSYSKAENINIQQRKKEIIERALDKDKARNIKINYKARPLHFDESAIRSSMRTPITGTALALADAPILSHFIAPFTGGAIHKAVPNIFGSAIGGALNIPVLPSHTVIGGGIVASTDRLLRRFSSATTGIKAAPYSVLDKTLQAKKIQKEISAKSVSNPDRYKYRKTVADEAVRRFDVGEY